ncbi:MAG: phenylalanine--tRNA ligase subunit beta [Acidimicrobiales bacterium]
MKVVLSWLRDFVDLDEAPEDLRETFDDLGLVVDGVERVGEGLDDVLVSRVVSIAPINGADKIRLVGVDAGDGVVEVVCGAWNFDVGDLVPFVPAGSSLPGGVVIARRQMRGVTSNGMLCSARELRLADDHQGLLILDTALAPQVGRRLVDALGLAPDVVFDVTVEGNRPNAWSVEGVARDLSTRLSRPAHEPVSAAPDPGEATSSRAGARLDAPDLCGRLTVSVLSDVVVGASPAWVARRLTYAGMRPINNVVDASNLVMLELGQPTHPYDAARVAGRTIGARRAVPGETVVTLDGVARSLATAGRGLGDTGEDCVIVDGDDKVIGLAGVMGGESSEITTSTTEVLVEAAFFDAMGIARTSKRHGLRTEASARFERGVDPDLALRAVGRMVSVLRESSPTTRWLANPLDLRGTLPVPSTVELSSADVARALGTELDRDEYESHLRGLGFTLDREGDVTRVTAPGSRPDVRGGLAGRADVIEEIARLHGYRRLPRHTPTWPEPGAVSDRLLHRRRMRDALVDLGGFEAWTPTLISDDEFDLAGAERERVRVANPLTADESVLRPTMITGLVRAWGRNLDRGTGDVVLCELGVVFAHPSEGGSRATRGGAGGTVQLELPREDEFVTVVLGRPDDDAATAVALWSALRERLGLSGVVARTNASAPALWHPTRVADLVDRASGALLGRVGEVDPGLVERLAPAATGRRAGLLELSVDAIGDPARATRVADVVVVPSRYPSAIIDLAFVAPDALHADDLAQALRDASDLVEDVALFDVYRGAGLADATRSVAYRVRLSSPDETLGESVVAEQRRRLIDAGAAVGAALR